MGSLAFRNELQRATARPDIDYLLRCVRIYEGWSALLREDSDEWYDELDLWFEDVNDEPDRSLALVILAMANSDDPKFLAVVAAGLLEDILTEPPSPSDELFDRILAEARLTPRFRWMLSGVWTMSMRPEQASAMAGVVGRVDCNRDPLPPRPWA